MKPVLLVEDIETDVLLMQHVWRDVLGMAPPQLRNVTGEIVVPEKAQKGDYDLVCIGSPTWFFRPSIPIRSYLKSEAA